MVFDAVCIFLFPRSCCIVFIAVFPFDTHTYTQCTRQSKGILKVDAYLPFFAWNVSSFAAFSHISDRSLLCIRVCLYVWFFCGFAAVYFNESICGTVWQQQTEINQINKRKKKYMLQCNKYKMMALNYTEADSPTNLTINNVARCWTVFFMIIYSSSSSIAKRCVHAWVSVECVENTKFALIIMRCLKTVLIKRK